MPTPFTRRSVVAALVVAVGVLPAGASAQEPDYNGNTREDCNDPHCFPKKGVEAGSGGSASDGSSALPVALGGGAALTAAAGAGGLALRRRLN
jgi:hypothetical protein